ncbi:MAG TPA: urea carboxylase-associated family protein [Saprospiraceae bacterium]|nr:urea carboxylase-associated family protein [Saprospiraceae bacterium]
MPTLNIIPPRSGTSFVVKKGQYLKIVDLEGEQVSDLVTYHVHDIAEYLSSGRTIDYAETVFLTKGHHFYSNRSNVMFTIVEDTVGRHDFLLTPCSAEMFRIIYGHNDPHRGCFGNLCVALEDYKITPDQIHTTFNVFMHVSIDQESGKIKVLPPKSKKGDYIVIEASMDLIVGLTACSAEMSNNYTFKPIGYEVMNAWK